MSSRCAAVHVLYLLLVRVCHEDAIIIMLLLQGRCNSDPNARSVTVMITDNCPQCEADHIDVQALTYNKVHWPLARPARKLLQAD